MKFGSFEIFNKIDSSISKEDLQSSKYSSMYNYHKKRSFKDFLEKDTLDRVNILIKNIFPKRIKKEIKKEMIDCIVIFLKFISINYDYWPGEEIYNREYNKIIRNNFNKLSN